MLLQAVIERELRVQSRSWGTIWLRVLTGGAAAAVLGIFFFFSRDTAVFGRKIVGPWLFAMLHTTLSVLLAIVLPPMCADTLSRERREGTLGVLLLTPLRPGTIVAGKMGAHLLRALTLWLATVPVLMVPLLLGGVGLVDVTFALVIELGVVSGCLAAGLLASSRSERSGRAVALAAGLALIIGEALALLTFLGLWPYLLAQQGSPYARYIVPTALLGPWFVGSGMIANGFSGILGQSPAWMKPALWTSLATIPIGSAAVVTFAFWSASRSIRNLGKEPERTPQQEARRKFWLRPLLPRWSRLKMRRLLARNPMLWLYTFQPSSRLHRWGWCGVVLLVWLGVYAAHIEDPDTEPWVIALPVVLTIALSYAATESFRREMEEGALELLLVTPLKAAGILRARVMALWIDFLPSLAAATVLLFLWTTLHDLTSAHAAVAVMAWSSFAALPLIGSRLAVRRLSTLPGWGWTLLLGLALPATFAALAAASTEPAGGEGSASGYTLRFLAVFTLFQAAEALFCARMTVSDLVSRRYQLKPLRRIPG